MRVSSFDEAYSNILWQLVTCPDYVVDGSGTKDEMRLSGYRELSGFQFKLTNIEDCTLTHNRNRKFKLDYAKEFFNYIMTGEISDAVRGTGYLVEFEGRNTQYGPRINTQLANLLDELIRDKGSRRGTIVILDKDDQSVFSGKSSGDTKIEYPCTNSLTFSIRDNKLQLSVNMRSQSACMVLPYDIFNWVSLMKLVRDNLRIAYPDLECGVLTYQVASLHYYDYEETLVKSILAEYGLLV